MQPAADSALDPQPADLGAVGGRADRRVVGACVTVRAGLATVVWLVVGLVVLAWVGRQWPAPACAPRCGPPLRNDGSID